MSALNQTVEVDRNLLTRLIAIADDMRAVVMPPVVRSREGLLLSERTGVMLVELLQELSDMRLITVRQRVRAIYLLRVLRNPTVEETDSHVDKAE